MLIACGHVLGKQAILKPHQPCRQVRVSDPGALQVEALGHGQDDILPPRPADLGKLFGDIRAASSPQFRASCCVSTMLEKGLIRAFDESSTVGAYVLFRGHERVARGSRLLDLTTASSSLYGCDHPMQSPLPEQGQLGVPVP